MLMRKHIWRYIFNHSRGLYIAICSILLLISVLFFSIMLMHSGYTNIERQLNDHGLELIMDHGEMNGLDGKLLMIEVVAGLVMVVLSTIIILLHALLLYKFVKDNERVIGILRGLGYSKQKVILSFIPFLLSLTVPVILGFFISISVEEDLFTLIYQDINILYQKAEHSWVLALVSILVMLIVYASLTIIIVLRLLTKSPVDMIHVHRPSPTKYKRYWTINFLKGIRKLQLKYILSQPVVFIIMLFTGFSIGVQLIVGFSIYEFPKKLASGLSTQFKYDYDIRFEQPYSTELETKVQQDDVGYSYRPATLQLAEKFAEVEMIIVERPEIEHQSLLRLNYYNHNTPANGMLNHGVAISQWLANKYNLSTGDTISLRIEEESYEMAVAVIHAGLQGQELYTAKRYYEKMTSNPLTSIDGIYTNDAKWQAYYNAPVKSIIYQQDIVRAALNNVEHYKLIAIGLLVFGIVIGAILFSIALHIVIQNGTTNILTLKALGYSSKQLYTVVIEGYLIVLLCGMLTARPYLTFLTKSLFNFTSRSNTYYFPINASLAQNFFVAVSLIMLFTIISLFYLRKLSKMKSYSMLMQDSV